VDNRSVSDRLRELVQPLLDREATARLLAEQVPPGVVFVGLSGIDLVDPTYTILPELLVLRRVTNAPGITHVYTAAAPSRIDHLGVGRYSAGITAELIAGNPASGAEEIDSGFLHDIAWHAIALLKLRGAQDILAPVSANSSWDTIAARKGDVVFSLLDDVPRRVRSINRPRSITQSDVDWVAEHYEAAFRLRSVEHSRRFGLAFNVSYTWNHTSDLRLALANLWVGIEALFGSRTDRPVTKKLVQRVGEWLGDANPGEIEALYGRRCDAVHGRWVNPGDLVDPIEQSWDVLRRCVMLAVERSGAPLPDWPA
jgi:hypothetical protein